MPLLRLPRCTGADHARSRPVGPSPARNRFARGFLTTTSSCGSAATTRRWGRFVSVVASFPAQTRVVLGSHDGALRIGVAKSVDAVRLRCNMLQLRGGLPSCASCRDPRPGDLHRPLAASFRTACTVAGSSAVSAQLWPNRGLAVVRSDRIEPRAYGRRDAVDEHSQNAHRMDLDCPSLSDTDRNNAGWPSCSPRREFCSTLLSPYT